MNRHGCRSGNGETVLYAFALPASVVEPAAR